MNFVTFGNETINLATVTHITVDKSEDPCIRFNFADSGDCVTFHMLMDNKPDLVYHEVKKWLEKLQQK